MWKEAKMSEKINIDIAVMAFLSVLKANYYIKV